MLDNYYRSLDCEKSWWNALSLDPSLEHKGTVSDTRIQGFKDTIKGHGSYHHLGTRNQGQTEIAMPAVQVLAVRDTLVSFEWPFGRSFSGDQGARNHPSHCIYGIDGHQICLLHSTDDVVEMLPSSRWWETAWGGHPSWWATKKK